MGHTDACVLRRAALVAQGLDPEQGIFRIYSDMNPGECWYCRDSLNLQFITRSGKVAPMANANDHQVGGSHYKTGGKEHWDMVEEFNLDYFQGQITKYLFRWRQKGGVRDLEKARHFLDKYIELAQIREAKAMATKCDARPEQERFNRSLNSEGSNAFGSEKGTGYPEPGRTLPPPPY